MVRFCVCPCVCVCMCPSKVIRWESTLSADLLRVEYSYSVPARAVKAVATPDFQRVIVGTSKRELIMADITPGVCPCVTSLHLRRLCVCLCV